MPGHGASRAVTSAAIRATGVNKPAIGAEVASICVSGVVGVGVWSATWSGPATAGRDRRPRPRARDDAAAARVAEANRACHGGSGRRLQLHGGARRRDDLDLARKVRRGGSAGAGRRNAGLRRHPTELRTHGVDGRRVASVSMQERETVAASFAAPTFVALLDLARSRSVAVDDRHRRIHRRQMPFAVEPTGRRLYRRVTTIHPRPEPRQRRYPSP
jgi:hypothetical protein